MKVVLTGMSAGFIGSTVFFVSNGEANVGTVLAGVLLAHLWLIYLGFTIKARGDQ